MGLTRYMTGAENQTWILDLDEHEWTGPFSGSGAQNAAAALNAGADRAAYDWVDCFEAEKRMKAVALQTFDTGAVRGTDANGTRFDLISPHILQALAETYAEGAQKYGDDNWLKGIPSKDLMNHALRHINLWQLGDASEDHLAHAMWNLGAIIHFTKTRPELIVRQYAPQPE